MGSLQRNDERYQYHSECFAKNCVSEKHSGNTVETQFFCKKFTVGRSYPCCRIEFSWSPRFWAEFNDWFLACRVIRIIGLRSSIPLLFMTDS